MLSLLFFAVGSFAICPTNPNGTDCMFPIDSDCMPLCIYYAYERTCNAVPGCNWTSTRSCSAANISANNDCYSFNESSTCNANPLCFYRTAPCSMSGGQCFLTDKCYAHRNQTSCTGASGCYWRVYNYSTTYLGPVVTNSRCMSCFAYPAVTANKYATDSLLLGQRCYQGNVDLTFLSVTASPTGCSGGLVGEASFYQLRCNGGFPDLFPPAANKTNTTANTAFASSPLLGFVFLLHFCVWW